MSKFKQKLRRKFNWLFNTANIFRSIWVVLFFAKRAATFKGYFHFKIAILYARKRKMFYRKREDVRKKEYGVFVYGDETLIVLNHLELKKVRKIIMKASTPSYKSLFNKISLWDTMKKKKKK